MFGWLTREAIRTVRASMIAAGAPTRQRKPNGAPPLPPIVYDEAVPPVKVTTEAAIAAVENCIITAQVLALAPKSIARGLRMIHFECQTVEAAAKAATLSRFQLSRQIFAFAIEMRAAA